MPPNPLEGFTFDPVPKAEPKGLEGFTFDPTAGEAQGERTWTGHPAPTTVREGVRQIGRDVMEAGRRVGGALESAGKTSYGLLTGEIEPTPENVLPAVAATITPAARGAQAAVRAGVEATLPRFTQSAKGQATAESLAGVPVVGKPIREAAAKGIGEFEGQVAAAERGATELYGRAETAATRATGAEPSQSRAGLRLREGAKDEIYFMPGATQTERAAALHPSIERMRSGSPERATEAVLELAGTGSRANPAALASLRKSIVPADWAEVQGASFQRLGESHTYKRGGGIIETTFDPLIALEKYEALSPAGRNVLFGGAKAPFRAHLDSLAADVKSMHALSDRLAAESTKVEALRRIPQGTTVGGAAKAAGMAGWAMAEPMSALAAVIGARSMAKMMSKPHTTAALAAWSKAYVRFHQSGGSPAGLAALKIATNNLSNTSGESIDPDKLVEAMRGGAKAPAAQRAAAKQPGDTGDPRINDLMDALEVGPHNVAFTAGMSPRGLKSLGSMRRMDPSLIEDKRREPPPPPEIMSEGPAGADRRYERMTMNWRNYVDALPRGPLSNAAGLADLEAYRPPRSRSKEGRR